MTKKMPSNQTDSNSSLLFNSRQHTLPLSTSLHWTDKHNNTVNLHAQNCCTQKLRKSNSFKNLPKSVQIKAQSSSKMTCTYHTQNSLWLLLLNSWWDNNPTHKHYMSEILCPWRLSNYITLTLTINNGIQLTSFWFQYNQSRWFYFRVIYSLRSFTV